MRRLAACWFAGWLGLAGCSGENVVAGDGKSKAEQMQSSLPSWCSSVCSWLSGCEVDEGCSCSGDSCVCPGKVDDDCAEDCQEEMSRWTQGSDACAEAGARFQRCVEEVGCDVRTVVEICPVSEAEQAACPRPGNPDPSVTGGPNYGTGGTASNGPPNDYGSTGGTLVSGPAPRVTCEDGHGSGGGLGTGFPSLVCEQGHGQCSDAHDYLWYCVRNSETVASCSCLLDQQVVGGFDPGEGCPTISQVNQGCGWNLDVEL